MNTSTSVNLLCVIIHLRPSLTLLWTNSVLVNVLFIWACTINQYKTGQILYRTSKPQIFSKFESMFLKIWNSVVAMGTQKQTRLDEELGVHHIHLAFQTSFRWSNSVSSESAGVPVWFRSTYCFCQTRNLVFVLISFAVLTEASFTLIFALFSINTRHAAKQGLTFSLLHLALICWILLRKSYVAHYTIEKRRNRASHQTHLERKWKQLVRVWQRLALFLGGLEHCNWFVKGIQSVLGAKGEPRCVRGRPSWTT